MTPVEIHRIIEQGENERVEFKVNFNNETIIALNAFAGIVFHIIPVKKPLIPFAANITFNNSSDLTS